MKTADYIGIYKEVERARREKEAEARRERAQLAKAIAGDPVAWARANENAARGRREVEDADRQRREAEQEAARAREEAARKLKRAGVR